MKKVLLIIILLNFFLIFAQQQVCAKKGSGWHYYLFNIGSKEFNTFRTQYMEHFKIEKELNQSKCRYLDTKQPTKMVQYLLMDAYELLSDEKNTVAIVYFNIEDSMDYDLFLIHRVKNKYTIEYWEIGQ